MNLGDYRETFYTFSGKASDITRQLAFAGIALIWVFKIDKAPGIPIPSGLLWPALLFAVTLAFDLTQSVLGAAIWGCFAHYYEREGKEDDDELDAPFYFPWPINISFMLKIASLATAYVLVVVYLYGLTQAR